MINMSDINQYVNPMERLDRLKEKWADDFLEVICTTVAMGGSLINLCEDFKIPYGRTLAWVNQDRGRAAQYKDAENARSEWVKERVLSELRAMGTYDIMCMFDKKGQVLPPEKWPKDFRASVKSVDFTDKGKVRKVTLCSKEKSLELLGKNLQLFIDRVEHTGKVTLEDLIADSRKGIDTNAHIVH